MKPIQVLFDEPLLARLDADEEVRADGRSAVLRRAAAEYLRRRRARQTSERYRQAYGAVRQGLGAEYAGWPDEGAWPEQARGEIWMDVFRAPDKRRPVLVITRQEVIRLLHTVMVAPITSTIRGAPSEVVVGVGEGLKHVSAVNLDHVQTVERSRLVRRLGHLDAAKMREVCRALAVATGCAD